MSSAIDGHSLEAEILTIHFEGRVVRIVRITIDVADQRTATIFGDFHTRRFAHAIGEPGRPSEEAPARCPVLCTQCSRHIRPRENFKVSIVLPADGDSGARSSLAACGRCATSAADVLACADREVARIWSDFRPKDIHFPAGRE